MGVRRVALRADASLEIGAGHVSRQLAVASELVHHSEVHLYASVTGPAWLRQEIIGREGVHWIEVRNADFSPQLFCDVDYDAIIVDSYLLSQSQWKRLLPLSPKVAAIIDGPWQRLQGGIAIAPVLNSRASWLNAARKHFKEFHAGPEFVPLRQEILFPTDPESNISSSSGPTVTLSLGGGARADSTSRVALILLKALDGGRLNVFLPQESRFDVSHLRQDSRVNLLEAGPLFLTSLEYSDFAVVGSGTTVAEVLYLCKPAIFMALADNQIENSRFLSESLGQRVVNLNDPNFTTSLTHAVQDLMRSPEFVAEKRINPVVGLDGKGSERIAAILLEE